MASAASTGSGRGDPADGATDRLDCQDAVAALQAQVRSLRRRLQLLEHENQMLLTRMSSCRQCYKMGLKGKLSPQCKANWTDEYKKAFIDICLDEVRKGNRPSTSFNRSGWVNITERFNDLKGTKYVKGQFKNLYTVMRDSWREWKCLVNRTNGWGWDPVLQTIDCDLETWEEYCKTHKQAKQFWTRPLLFEDDLDKLFNGAIAADGETYCSSEPDIDRVPLRRPSDQFEVANTLETFELSNVQAENDVLSEETPKPKNKRRSISTAHEHRKKKKIRPHVPSSLANPNNISHAQMANVSGISSGSPSHPPSVADVIRLLDHVEDIEMGSDLYLGALRVLKDTTEREFFVALDPRVRSAWLRNIVYGNKNS